MTESQNLGAESQVSDTIQPIVDGSKTAAGPVDAVVVTGADERVEVELGSGGREAVKRKRGRPPRAQAKPPPAKKIKVEEEEEDVCFICFDGGSLVLCDRRGCPKAYHPACIKRDEEFFESAATWNCGWHICSICQKTSHHMCYTCTYSLCKVCIRKADYVCVRGDKGFCTICMKTIMLIENNGQGDDGKVQADFDDKLSWEYLFKVYWVYLKGKLSLNLNELTEANNPWKEASTTSSTDVHYISNDLKSIMTSTTSVANLDENESKRRKIDEQIDIEKKTINLEKSENGEIATTEWATKELLEFVAYMKNGNTSVLSRLDVEALMTEYVNKNNLCDPKKKNQIICDSRLTSLFNKQHVGHIQIRKLLEHHFVVKDDSRKKRVNRTVDPDWNIDTMVTVKDKKRRNRRKSEERAVQSKLDDFAAIDVYNINLIYLRRDLMEILLDDSEFFDGQVVGSIVRLRISGSDLKHDMYRLVQVVGTSKVDVPYKIGGKMTDIMLEVLNLDKKETMSIDMVSDQEFSEEECRRLQRSIRCGLMKHFTVGEIQEKAVALQSVKLNDWLEKEILRLNHLRDIASEKGQKKKYQEFVEKLLLLKTPDERERRLHEIPAVHSDPKMNPHYESDDTEDYFNNQHEDHTNPRSPKKRASRSNNNADIIPTVEIIPNIEEESTKATVRIQTENDTSASTSEKTQHMVDCHVDLVNVDCNISIITKLDNQTALSSSVSNTAPETTSSSPNEVTWHYRDPNGKIQGPFPLIQLQKWSTAGYFPTDMKIWTHHEDKTQLLNDILKENFQNYDTTVTPADKIENQINGVDGSSCQSFGGAHLPVTCFEPLVVPGDHAATPTSNVDQNVNNNGFTTWHGMGEMIEFSTLAEESVSDLLAEVDAMESQYGLPSPTSRRNSFVDDLFNGSFDEFSPTHDQGTRSDGFSSSGDIQLNSQPTTTTVIDEPINVFDFMKTTNEFKWPETIDINRSAKAEVDEGEMETKVMQPPKTIIGIGAKLVTRVAQIKGFTGCTPATKEEEDGEFVSPQPPPPLPRSPILTLGLDPFDPPPESQSETIGKFVRNTSRDSGRTTRSSLNKQSSFSGGLRLPPAKGQRVCRFYESGRCKKGASCKYLHQLP